MNQHKHIPIKPLSGVLDVRSAPSEMTGNTVRWRLNWSLGKDGRMRRQGGFSRFLPATPYNNSDLHDQMIVAQKYYGNKTPVEDDADKVNSWPDSKCLNDLKIRTQNYEPITFLFQATATWGERRLIVGTQSRLYELNQVNGAYRILADGLGGSTRTDLSVRWKAAQVDDLIIFTNGVDRPLSYKLDDPHLGCDIRATRDIDDLGIEAGEPITTVTAGVTATTETPGMNIERAGCVASFNSVMFLADVTTGNRRFPNRIMWSDYKKPLTWLPIRSKFVGFQDLPNGHKIVRLEPFLGYLFVFTTAGIYAISPTGSPDAPWTFQPIYESFAGDRCLAFPNAVANDGSTLLFMGTDGIYSIDQYSLTPTLVEWLHKGTGTMYEDLDQERCFAHVGGYNSLTGEFWFSYTKASSAIAAPQNSIVIYPKGKFVSYVDVGFFCFLGFKPDPRYTFRDLMLNMNVCDVDTVTDLFVKEGMPRGISASETLLTSLFSDDPAVEVGELEMEDFTGGGESETSLCYALNGQTAADFCSECGDAPLFIAVYTGDNCIKQLDGGTQSREVCDSLNWGGSMTGFAHTAYEATYRTDGILSIIRPRPQDYNDPSSQKNVSYMVADIDAETHPTLSAVVAFRVGTSYAALDPNNTDGCDVKWSGYINRTLRCSQRLSAGEYILGHLAPAIGIEGPFHKVGNWIYTEIVVGKLTDPNDDKSLLEAGMGGACSLSGVTLAVKKLSK